VFESAAARVKRLVQPATWSAFWETMVVGRTCESVAEELKISVGAIYVARSRVIARLRAVAEELEANDA
jgi:RNA polymerase sigma-70 factor (ECF subfamily)